MAARNAFMQGTVRADIPFTLSQLWGGGVVGVQGVQVLHALVGTEVWLKFYADDSDVNSDTILPRVLRDLAIQQAAL